MKLPVVVGLLLPLVACLKAPPPPAPAQLTVAKPRSEVVQIASRELAAAGLDVTTADTAAGLVVARRVRTPSAHGGEVTCKYQRGSIADERAEATLVVTLTARGVNTGSDVQITSTVRTDRSNLPSPFKAGPNDSDCVSSGTIEKRVADALR